MSVSIEKLITFQDYSVKYDINSKGLKPSAYYDTLKWLFDNINDIKLTEERKNELLDNLVNYTNMRLLPQDLVDILSREDAVKLAKLHDDVRKVLGLKKEKVVEFSPYALKEEAENNEQNYDTKMFDFELQEETKTNEQSEGMGRAM